MDITSQINEMGQIIVNNPETTDPGTISSVSSNILGSSFDGITSALSGFTDFFAKIDWTPFRWLLISLAVFLPIWIIWLFLSGRVSFFGFNFGEDFGLKLITGFMGASKTRNTFQSAYFWKKENPNGILISNIPYDFTDIFFNSKRDFDFILRDVIQYIRDSNDDETLRNGSATIPPIRIVVDEAHYYLFARDFKGFTKDALIVLTQCRKRKIQVDFITQELGQIDVFIRRLCPYIVHYQKTIDNQRYGPLLYKQSLYYVPDPDTTSMIPVLEQQDPLQYSYILGTAVVNLFKKKQIEGYYQQEYLTRFVIGSTNEYASPEDIEHIQDLQYSHNYEKFREMIKEKSQKLQDDITRQLSNKKRMLKFNPFDQSVNKDIIEEQKKLIQNLIKLIPEDELVNLPKDILEIQEDPEKN